jgi:microcystin-dependent protein
MPLETAAHISGLVASNPASSDGLNQADDHMRLIKQVLLTDVGSSLTSGNLTAPDGTSSAPSIGFAADATAGFYRKGTGQTAVVGSLIGQGSVDIGFLGFYAGSAVPSGYLACDGQAVSRTTYAALFNAIGTTWGAGDGSTTFNVPPLNDRFLRHRNASGPAGAVGTTQAAQTAPHTHTGSGTTGGNSADHTHTFSGTTGVDSPDHTHQVNVNAGGASGGVTGGGSFSLNVSPSTVTSGGANSRHQHSFSGTTAGASATHTHTFAFTTSNGSADGTETRPLSATVLFCIRAF